MSSYDFRQGCQTSSGIAQPDLPPEPALRLKALETVLVEKGFLAADAVDKWLDDYSENVGPMNGAKVIARAWTDPEFAENGWRNMRPRRFRKSSQASKDYPLSQCSTRLISTTLSSAPCVPAIQLESGECSILVQVDEYRARVVRDPRGVLAEFGTTCRTRFRSRCGIRLRTVGTWWSRSVQRERTAGPKRTSPASYAQCNDRDDEGPVAKTGGGVMDTVHDLGGRQGFRPIRTSQKMTRSVFR